MTLGGVASLEIDPQFVPNVIAATRDRHPGVRYAAVSALGGIVSRAAADALRERLRDKGRGPGRDTVGDQAARILESLRLQADDS